MPLPSRPCSAALCWCAYASALVAAVALAPTLHSVLPDAPLRRALLLDVVGTLVVYAFSLAADNSSVYDPYWCVAPLALLFYWKAHAPGGFWFYEPRETLIMVLTWVWAVRFFVLVPWEGWVRGLMHEDWRYDKIRAGMPNALVYWGFSLTSLHLTPTLLVFGALAPAARAVTQGDTAPSLCPTDAVGTLICVGAIIVEAVADEQLRRHRAQSDGTRACRHGLWSVSRHPNYFAECLFWSGLAVIGVGAGAVQAEPLLLVGPMLLWAFFRCASVPLMDARSLERRADYREVMATTSALWPWWRSTVDVEPYGLHAKKGS